VDEPIPQSPLVDNPLTAENLQKLSLQFTENLAKSKDD